MDATNIPAITLLVALVSSTWYHNKEALLIYAFIASHAVDGLGWGMCTIILLFAMLGSSVYKALTK